MKVLDMPEFQGSDLIATDIEAMAQMSAALKRRWDIGAIYISVDPTSPEEFIGGRWKRIGEGRVLVTPGFTNFRYDGDTRVEESPSKGGQEGGSMRHTHLTPVGYDSNNVYFLMDNVAGEMRVPPFQSVVKYHCAGITVWKDLNNFDDSTVRVAYTRENTSYPPYYTAYMWERVG